MNPVYEVFTLLGCCVALFGS